MTDADIQYQELSAYIGSGLSRICAETLPDTLSNYLARRAELKKRLRAFITEIRMIDREISITSAEGWRRLPVIES